MSLRKIKHNADSLYQLQAEEYKKYNIDFFSCYENSNKDCINCETTFKETFLKNLNELDIEKDWVFMDCGSGLGFPCFLASPFFKKVIGVEIVPEIAQISINNLEKMKVTNSLIINSDINDISENVLDQVNVFYLFNPFVNQIFENFIQNVVNSIHRKNREVWIIYVNATQENILKKYCNIFELKKEKQDFRKINFYHHNLIKFI